MKLNLITVCCGYGATLILAIGGCVSRPGGDGQAFGYPIVPNTVGPAAPHLAPGLVAMERLVQDFSSVVERLSEERFLSLPDEAVEAYLTKAYRQELKIQQQAAIRRGEKFSLPGIGGASDLSLYHCDSVPALATQADVDFAVSNRMAPATGYHILVKFKRVDGNWRIDGISDLGNG